MIYIVTIIVTLSMTYIYQKSGGCRIQDGFIFHTKDGVRLRVKNKSIMRSVFFVLMITPAVLVSGLRYGISVDYSKIYVPGFYRIIENNTYENEFEIGFKLLVKLCAVFVRKPWFMFFIMAVITLLLFFHSFRRCSKNFMISVSLFFLMGIYFDTFNGIRQYVAVGIFLYAVRYVQEKNFCKFLILMISAGLFHSSAFFLIPVYWLNKVNINIKKWLVAIMILFLFRNQMTNLFVLILSNFGKYSDYVVRGTLENNTDFSTSGLLVSIIACIPCVINEKRMREEDEGKLFFNMVMIGIAIAAISGVLPLSERILYYCKGMYLLAIPFALNLCNCKKTQQLLSYGIILMYGSITTMGIIIMGWYDVLPYQSIFSK